MLSPQMIMKINCLFSSISQGVDPKKVSSSVGVLGGTVRFFQQQSQPFGPDPLPPLDERGGMQRSLLLCCGSCRTRQHSVEAAEPMPVRVLDPLLQQRFVQFVEGILEIM